MVIGITADDDGHRDMTTSYEERINTVFEDMFAGKDLAAELDIPYEHVIYGTFPEVYGELVAERFPSHLKLLLDLLQPSRKSIHDLSHNHKN